MNDRPDDLSGALARATDAMEAPHLAETALRAARRRRARRRGVVAATSAALALVVVAVGVNALDRPAGSPPAIGVPTPATPPTPPAPGDPQPDPAPDLAPGVLQARWDPRDLDRLPEAGPAVAAALPDRVDPPASSPALAQDPIDAAVLAVVDGTTAQLLSPTGEWRSLDLPGRNARVTLSPAGTRVVVASSVDLVTTAIDLTTGESTPVPLPDGTVPFDFARWAWLDEETLLLDDAEGGWVVDPEAGEARRVAYPEDFTWTVDPQGQVLEASGPGEVSTLTDWAGGTRRTLPTVGAGASSTMAASSDEVVGTTFGLTPSDTVEGSTSRGLVVVVADRRTATPTAVLPVLDFEGNYSGGGLRVVAVTPDGAVLLSVRGYDAGQEDRVVAWDPDDGTVSSVATVSADLGVTTFAETLVAVPGP